MIKTILEIGREVLTAPREGLTPEQAEILALLLTLEMAAVKPPVLDDFLDALIDKRLTAHYGSTQRVTSQLRAFLSVAADRPGTALLLLAGALAVRCVPPVRLIDLWSHVKDGLPTTEALQGVWQGQKTESGGNSVDRPECWA